MPQIGVYLKWKDYERMKRKAARLGKSPHKYMQEIILADLNHRPQSAQS